MCQVCHPGVMRQILIDVYLMRVGASFLQLIIPSFKHLNPVKCVDEFGILLEAQTDLRNEAASLMEFGRNFETEPHVVFPSVYFSAQKVLIESYSVRHCRIL